MRSKFQLKKKLSIMGNVRRRSLAPLSSRLSSFGVYSDYNQNFGTNTKQTYLVTNSHLPRLIFASQN